MNVTKYIAWFNVNLFHSYYKDELFQQFSIATVGALKELEQKEVLKLNIQRNQISGYVEKPAYLDSIAAYLTADHYYFIIYPADNQLLSKTVFKTTADQECTYYSNLYEGQQSVQIRPKIFTMPVDDTITTLQVKDMAGHVIQEVNLKVRMTQVSINLMNHDDGIYQVWSNQTLEGEFFVTNQNLDTAMAIVQLATESLEAQNTLNIHFKAKEAFWNFKIAIKANITVPEEQIQIEDFQQTTFSAPIKTNLSQNIIAYEFNSSQPMAIKEEFEDSPRLKLGYSDQYSVQTKQMEVKLPNPSSTHLKRYDDGEHKGELFLSKIIYI